MTKQNLARYKKLYGMSKKEEELYQKKKYDVRMTDRDRKISESSFQFRENPMTFKHLLIFIIMIILILLLAGSNYGKQSSVVICCYIFLFFMLSIALKYDVNSKFYIVFVVLFVLIFLTTKNFSIFPEEEFLENNKNNKTKARVHRRL